MFSNDLPEIYVEIGRRITALREERGLTQEVLATRARLGVVFLARIEDGTRRGQTATLRRVAAALEVPFDELVPAHVELPTAAAASAGDGAAWTQEEQAAQIEKLVQIAKVLDRDAIEALIKMAIVMNPR